MAEATAEAAAEATAEATAEAVRHAVGRLWHKVETPWGHAAESACVSSANRPQSKRKACFLSQKWGGIFNVLKLNAGTGCFEIHLLAFLGLKKSR